MKQETFKKYGESRWQAFEKLLYKLEKKHRIKTGGFTSQYRRICHDLNIARANNFDSNLIERLNKHAIRGHQLLYRPSKFSFKQLAAFLVYAFPNAVRKEIKLVLFSILLFYGSLIGIFIYVRANHEVIYSIVDRKTIQIIESIYDPNSNTFLRHRGNESDAEMFGYYLYNNISIDFQTFAGGALLGLGSLFILLLNSVYIGSIAAHIVNIGFSKTFFPFVIGHSSLELTALVLIAVSGFRLGWSIIAPGRYSRKQSFKLAAHRAIPIVYGSVLMTFLAAIIEAFWSAYPLDSLIKYTVGAILWAILLIYFLFSGWKHGS